MWDEVRRLNQERGMTIFLTTQYLEEADELADRAGSSPREESLPKARRKPEALDRIRRDHRQGLPGAAEQIAATLSSVDGLDEVEAAGDEVVISVTNGAKAISPVAVALSEAGIAVEGLTLRTPTLDDVFLHVTGERMGIDKEAS